MYNTRNIEEENNGIFDILSIDRVKNTFSVYTDLISCVLLKGLISNPVNLVSSKSCFLNAKRTKVFFFEKLLVQYFLDFFFSHYKQLIYLFEKKIWSIVSVSVFEKKINYDIGLFKKAKKEGLNIFNIEIKLSAKCMLKSARAFIIFNTLESLGDIIHSNPSAEDIEDEKFDLDFSLIFISKTDKNKLKEIGFQCYSIGKTME